MRINEIAYAIKYGTMEDVVEVLKPFKNLLKGVDIISDVDDVLQECQRLVCDVLGFPEHVYKDWGPTGNKLYDKKLEYFSDKEFVKSQTPTPFAQEFIGILKLLGANIHYVTAVHPNCLQERFESLERMFGATSAEITIMGDKRNFVGLDGRNAYQFDDKGQTIVESQIENAVLIRKPWGTKISGLPAVNNLREALWFVLWNEYFKHEVTPIKDDAIVILVGPTGSGKTDILMSSGLQTPVTYSTKKSKKYVTVSEDEFMEMKNRGDFAETTTYGGELYGVKIEDLKAGTKYIMSCDLCGALSMKLSLPERVVIVYVKETKENIIKSLLEKQSLSLDEKTIMLLNLDREIQVEKYCQYSISSLEDLESLLS